MQSPNTYRNKNSKLRRKLLLKSPVRYYQSAKPQIDLRSLTLEDFKPPIALKPDFPKPKAIKQTPLLCVKRHTKHLSDLYITGKYACIPNKFSPILQKNIGLSTTDVFPFREHFSIS